MADLFVYGTLTFDGVLKSLLGYVPQKEAVVVNGYYARTINLDGWEPFPVLMCDASRCVSGYVLKNLTAEDYKKLDCYEYLHQGYYIRTLLDAVAVTTPDGTQYQAEQGVIFYEPTDVLLSIGLLEQDWDVATLDPELESVYVNSVLPKFKNENPHIFMLED